MKSEKTLEPAEPIFFPILMEHKNNDFVVLFTSSRKGIVIDSQISSYEIGHTSNFWHDAGNTQHWHPFQGKITLSN